MRATGAKRGRSYLLAVIVALGFRGIYEVREGIVAEIVAPNSGNRWLGSQGGPWGVQKDVARTFIAALIATLVMRWRASRCRSRRHP